MPTLTFAPLLHLLGFFTGAALYALLLVLVSRRGEPMRGDYLPLLTAMLGLLWNVIGLAAYGIRDFAGREPSAWLVATAYSALGFLPAVVVHSVLRGRERAATLGARKIVIIAAYLISMAAETMMYWAARSGDAPSTPALKLLTWSYAALTIPVLLLTRRRADSARGWSIVALAVFAVSALHLSHAEGPHQTLVVELIGHHASVPLIFAILYQDFRFALADQFLKRALALFAVIAIASGLYFGVAVPVFDRHDYRSDAVGIAIVLMLWLGTATVYPFLTRGAGWFVDRVVLRRSDYGDLLERATQTIAAASSAQDVLDAACEAARTAMSAEYVHCDEDDGAAPEPLVKIETTEPPRYALAVGPLRSGRSLLSDDQGLLRAIAGAAARRIDALRLARERYEQSVREQEMSKLATEAELRALRAQVNPHFLFNALNTIEFLVQTSPERARATLRKLTALLRGVLRSGENASTVGEEIDLVSAYLEIEQARFEERLRVQIDVPDDVRPLRMPPLIVQPLVENAVKHGIARSRRGGELRVIICRDGAALRLTVTNTGAPATEFDIAHGRRRGFGLANIERRLAHLFKDDARLTLTATDSETVAEVVMPIGREALRDAEQSA